MVFVRDRRLVGPRNGVHLKQVRPTVDRESQIAIEDAELHPGERHREAGPSLLTSHDDAENADTPRRISSGFRGKPKAAAASEAGRIRDSGCSQVCRASPTAALQPARQ